jgi:hypothetical protein
MEPEARIANRHELPEALDHARAPPGRW